LLNGSVVLIDVAGVDGFCGWILIADSRQDRAEYFFTEEDQCSHGTDGSWRSMVAVGFRDLANEILTPEFLQLVSSATRTIGGISSFQHGLNSGCVLSGRESVGGEGQHQSGAQYRASSCLLPVNAANARMAHLRWLGKLVQGVCYHLRRQHPCYTDWPESVPGSAGGE